MSKLVERTAEGVLLDPRCRCCDGDGTVAAVPVEMPPVPVSFDVISIPADTWECRCSECGDVFWIVKPKRGA